MLAYCRRTEPDIALQRKLWVPQPSVWRRIVAVGAELTLMCLTMSVVHVVIRNAGASAQARFGIGFCIVSLLVMPGLAITLAAAIARVREVFRTIGTLSTAVMIAYIPQILSPRAVGDQSDGANVQNLSEGSDDEPDISRRADSGDRISTDRTHELKCDYLVRSLHQHGDGGRSSHRKDMQDNGVFRQIFHGHVVWPGERPILPERSGRQCNLAQRQLRRSSASSA
jgi:hypothetical protein